MTNFAFSDCDQLMSLADFANQLQVNYEKQRCQNTPLLKTNSYVNDFIIAYYSHEQNVMMIVV